MSFLTKVAGRIAVIMVAKYAIVGIPIVALIAQTWLGNRKVAGLEAERDAAELQRDSAYAESAVQQARADGWAARFGTDSHDSLQARLDSIPELAGNLESANIRVEQLASVVVTLMDSLESTGETVEAPTVDSVGEIHGAWQGEVADDLLTGHWLFRLPEISLDLSIEASCPVELVSTRAGDGRVVVFGRGQDPRCTPHINELIVDPPPPEVVHHGPGFLERLFWAAGGLAGGYLIWGRD